MHFWDILHRWDQILTLFINSFHIPATDQFMMFMSDRDVWFPLYAIIAFFLFKRLGWKKGGIAILCMVLTLVLCDQTSNLLKYSVARLRPCYSSQVLFGGLHDSWKQRQFLRILFGHMPPTRSDWQCAPQFCSATTRSTHTKHSLS